MTPADQQQVQGMIQQALAKSNQQARFNLNVNPRITHNGLDSPQISQSRIASKLRAEGTVTFSEATTYKLGTTFNPTAVWVHGNVTGPSGEKFLVVGNAQLGPSFYFQPQSATSVSLGGPQQNVVQSASYFGFDSAKTFHTLVGEEHIVDISYSGLVFARATVGQWVEQANSTFVNAPPQFDATGIYISVNTLDSGWIINLSWTVT